MSYINFADGRMTETATTVATAAATAATTIVCTNGKDACVQIIEHNYEVSGLLAFKALGAWRTMHCAQATHFKRAQQPTQNDKVGRTTSQHKP